MRNSKVIEEWHDAHVMPKNPTRAQRVQWHAEHERACGCRPVPASLMLDVAALSKKSNVRRSN
ncbi:MAG TPA: hypothetical protein VGR53_01930 [Nitrososphaerales archaeon]|nr:hypothetical protein [Nitrososphaerales archaeon]